jgi:hypothetical protein
MLSPRTKSLVLYAATQLPTLQPPDILTPHAAKLQPRAIRHPRNLPLDPLSLTPQQRLLERLPPSAKPS